MKEKVRPSPRITSRESSRVFSSIMEYEPCGTLGLVDKPGHCSYSQAMLMIKCCGDIMQREQLLDSALNTLDKVGLKCILKVKYCE